MKRKTIYASIALGSSIALVGVALSSADKGNAGIGNKINGQEGYRSIKIEPEDIKSAGSFVKGEILWYFSSVSVSEGKIKAEANGRLYNYTLAGLSIGSPRQGTGFKEIEFIGLSDASYIEVTSYSDETTKIDGKVSQKAIEGGVAFILPTEEKVARVAIDFSGEATFSSLAFLYSCSSA